MKIYWGSFHNKETNIIMMIKRSINNKTHEYNGKSNNLKLK